jgi:hypothetical protein
MYTDGDSLIRSAPPCENAGRGIVAFKINRSDIFTWEIIMTMEMIGTTHT